MFELRDLLPSDSCYSAAMAEDVELAAELASDDEVLEQIRASKRAPTSPSFRGFNHDAADIKDLLAKLLQATAVREAKKAPSAPRPVSALDKAIREKRRAGLRSVVNRAIGKEQ